MMTSHRFSFSKTTAREGHEMLPAATPNQSLSCCTPYRRGDTDRALSSPDAVVTSLPTWHFVICSSGPWSEEEAARIDQIIQAMEEEGKTHDKNPQVLEGRFEANKWCDSLSRQQRMAGRIRWRDADSKTLTNRVAGLNLDKEDEIPWRSMRVGARGLPKTSGEVGCSQIEGDGRRICDASRRRPAVDGASGVHILILVLV